MTEQKQKKVVGGRCGCNGPVCGSPNILNARRTKKKDIKIKKEENEIFE